MNQRSPATRLDDRAVIRRQLRAATRSLLHPQAYAGTARELALAAFHVAAYPLGLLSPARPVELPLVSRRATYRPASALDPHVAETPVVLVHGYVHNHSAFLVMSSSLRHAGFAHVHGLNYNPLRADIPAIADMLAVEVDRVLAATGAGHCIVIGHSMGGIVARYYAQLLAAPGTIDTVVTLGSPHRGTYTAHLGPGPAAYQLRPRSPLLRRLEESARPGDIRWIAYYSDLDLMVTPAVNAKLVHPALQATNIRLRNTGHLSLLLSGEALRSIVDHLADRMLGRTGLPRTTSRQRDVRPALHLVAPSAADDQEAG